MTREPPPHRLSKNYPQELADRKKKKNKKQSPSISGKRPRIRSSRVPARTKYIHLPEPMEGTLPNRRRTREVILIVPITPEHSIGRSCGLSSARSNYNYLVIDPRRAALSRGYPTVRNLKRLHAREREREGREREKRRGTTTDPGRERRQKEKNMITCCSGLRRYRKSGVLRAKNKKKRKEPRPAPRREGGEEPRGNKDQKIRDFARDAKFRSRMKFSSEPPTAALFVVGKSRHRD